MKHAAQMTKPAEMVKNQYYSGEEYERYQKDLQKKQGEEYRDFLTKVGSILSPCHEKFKPLVITL